MRGNGTTTTWGYDAHGRMTSLSHDVAGTANDVTFGYTWNPAGQIQNRTVSNASYNFAPGSGVVGYDNDGLNRLTSVGGTGVTYDANHNIATAQGSSYGYDASNRLTSATIGGSGYSFAYDPADRLYSTSSSGVRFQYAGQQLVGEYNSSGALLVRHIPGSGLDMPVASVFAPGVPYQQLADERGSVVGLTDAWGGLAGVNVYDEYGVATASDRFQYTGQAVLAPGLYHYRARAYAPQLGRFLQTDPIGYAAGANMYAYVGGDPVNRVDPSGLEWGKPITSGECIARGGVIVPTEKEGVSHCVNAPGGGPSVGFGGSGGDVGFGGGGTGATVLDEVIVKGRRVQRTGTRASGMFFTPEYLVDVAACATLASRAGYGKCMESASQRAVARYRGTYVAPLIMEGPRRSMPRIPTVPLIIFIPPNFQCSFVYARPEFRPEECNRA